MLLHISIDLFALLGQLLFQASNQFSHLERQMRVLLITTNNKIQKHFFFYLISVVHKSRHNFLHSALNQNPAHHPDAINIFLRILQYFFAPTSWHLMSIPEALSIAINPVESLNDNVMFIEILL